MKMRLLPQIDLVRFMPLPRAEKKRGLERHREFKPKLIYAPVRASIGDLMNLRPGVFDAVHASWQQISRQIDAKSKHEAERIQNLAVGELIYNDTAAKNLVAYQHDLFPLKIGISSGVVLWNDFYHVIDSVPVFSFIDPRRSNGLTGLAKDVAFSLMHQRIRADGGDFSSAEFAIYRFPANSNGERQLHIETSEHAEIYPFEQLEQMIKEVYEVWGEVLTEREEAGRMAASSGKRGSLGI